MRFAVKPQVAPNGRRFLWVTGGGQDAPAGAGSDVEALLGGHVDAMASSPGEAAAHVQGASSRNWR